MRFAEREKRLIANLGGVVLAGLAIVYGTTLEKNSRGYRQVAEQIQEGHTFRLYAACSPDSAQFPPLLRDYRYIGGAANGKGMLAETDFLEHPMEIDRRRGSINDLFEPLGYYEFEATFAQRIKISGWLLCFPPNPFRG